MKTNYFKIGDIVRIKDKEMLRGSSYRHIIKNPERILVLSITPFDTRDQIWPNIGFKCSYPGKIEISNGAPNWGESAFELVARDNFTQEEIALLTMGYYENL